MTREEAIEELKTRYLTMSQRLDIEELHKANKAIDMAITALSQEEQSEWERDHEILKAYSDGQESMEGDKRNIEEIAEVMKCDADADTKCRMISNILNAKPHYFKLQEPCEDAISRQAVLEYIEGNYAELGHSSENELVCQDIKELPPVTPQSKIGQWLRMSDLSEQEDDRYKCSRCGNVVHHNDKMYLYTFNSWCGRCGSYNGRHINYEVEE